LETIADVRGICENERWTVWALDRSGLTAFDDGAFALDKA